MAGSRDFVIKGGGLVCYLGNAADITIPDGVRRIEMGAFIESKSLRSVKLPNSLRWIGQCAFAHCENLKSITIPASVTFIDSCAFLNSGLEEIIIEGKPEIRFCLRTDDKSIEFTHIGEQKLCHDCTTI